MGPRPETTVEELHEALESPAPPLLLDVREPYEWAVCRIEGARHVPLSRLAGRIDEIPRDRDVVVVCHHGVRSGLVVDRLRALGYDRVSNLRGGIDAWALQIDPSMARY